MIVRISNIHTYDKFNMPGFSHKKIDIYARQKEIFAICQKYSKWGTYKILFRRKKAKKILSEFVCKLDNIDDLSPDKNNELSQN